MDVESVEEEGETVQQTSLTLPTTPQDEAILLRTQLALADPSQVDTGEENLPEASTATTEGSIRQPNFAVSSLQKQESVADEENLTEASTATTEGSIRQPNFAVSPLQRQESVASDSSQAEGRMTRRKAKGYQDIVFYEL